MAAVTLLCLAPGAAMAQEKATPEAPVAARISCPPKPYRWQEDCHNLADAERNGLDRLRYVPITEDGPAWITFGGDMRVRADYLHDVDFGIGGQPGYLALSGRLLAHADVHAPSGARAFVQLGIVEQDGRKPDVRTVDESGLDVTQAFVDLPAHLGGVDLTLRLGRAEVDLSRNRLVTSRDGATLRRSFEGAKLDLAVGEYRVAVISARPMQLRFEPFADRVDKTERFNGLSVDLPPLAHGTLNLFLLDRNRDDGRSLRARGKDRRYSMGAHYVGRHDGWLVDFQGQWQTGRADGLPVRAYGVGVSFDREFNAWQGAAVGFDLVASSGDKASTSAIETFDPIYPNNFGLSDAPLIYQTNYVFGGGSLSARMGGALWTVGSNLLARHSTTDAVYAGGRPIPVAFGDQKLTSLLSQISARRSIGPHLEVYGSLVWAKALGALEAAGGQDAIYSRLQFTARF